MSTDDYNNDELSDEINRIEFEMNALSPAGELRSEFIEKTNADNINKIVKSLEIAHKISKKHAKIIAIEHLNVTSLYNKSITQHRVNIGLSIVIAIMAIKLFFFI